MPGLINETRLLTRVLSLEVANQTDVFLHSLEGSQLHGIVDHFYGVLQHLGTVSRGSRSHAGHHLITMLYLFVNVCTGLFHTSKKSQTHIQQKLH